MSQSPLPWTECPTFTIRDDRDANDRFASVDEDALKNARLLLGAVLADVPPQARRLAIAANVRTGGRFGREMKGAARSIGVAWQDVMLANLSYDLLIATLGCSTISLPTPDGPVVARNMDWWPEDLLAKASCVIRHEKGGEFRIAHAGWPGASGIVSGISAKGFCIVLNAVSCAEGGNKLGYPVLLHLRRVLEDARDFDEALEALRKTRLAAAALITLSGSENHQRVVVERTPTRQALRWAEPNEPLITTNDYRLLEDDGTSNDLEVCRTACSRFDFLSSVFREYDAGTYPSSERLLDTLQNPNVRQSITAQHVIMAPRSQSIELYVPTNLIG